MNTSVETNDHVSREDIYGIYLSAFENHPEAIFVLDSEGYFKHCNEQTYAILGCTPRDILERKFGDCAPASQRASIAKWFQDALNSKLNQQFEMHYPSHDGYERYILTTLVPVTTEDSNWVMGYCKDVTDRVHLEKELRESREYLARTQEAANLGTCLLDLESRIVEFDEHAQAIFGFPSRHVPLTEFHERIFPEDRDRIILAIQHAMKKPKSIHGAEYRMLHPDGSVRYVQVHRTTYSKTSDRPRLLGVVQDITTRKQAENKLLNSEKLSVVGELAAGMAHEILNPLTVAKGLTTLLQSNRVKMDKHDNYFQLVMESLEQIERITSEMLVLSKPQAEQKSPKNIADIVRDVMTLFEAEAFLHHVDITYQFDCDWALVMCNEHQVKQVFMNILKNALEATARKVAVCVNASNDNISVSIHDNGHGIGPKHMKHLGQPFYTTKETGTGLGLMVSKKIIHDHAGELKMTSEVGQGTCVTVELPRIHPIN